VRALASSPALDVLGVGLADGRALLYNIKYNELLMEFHNVAGAGSGAEQLLPGRGQAGGVAGGGGACTAISFKTGEGCCGGTQMSKREADGLAVGLCVERVGRSQSHKCGVRYSIPCCISGGCEILIPGRIP
jgi:hypothetical protein